MRRRRLAVVLAALALASCGGGDDGDDPGTGGTGGSTEPPPAQPPQGTNQAPAISGSPPSQVMVGNELDFTPTTADADGDSLSFTIQNQPDWATFDAATGQLSGSVGEADVGTYSDIRISVSDGDATVNLTAFSISVVATASGSATLSWSAPQAKTDGSPVDLAGYKIYWGSSSKNYSHSVALDTPGVASYVVDNLTPSTWYFAVKAVDSQGLESDYSNEATKQIL